MKLINQGLYVEKKSKFFSYYYEISSEIEVKEILDKLKNEHKGFRHIPYAYKIGNLVRKTDDKEPHNTAGTPLYNIIEKNSMDNCLLVVVRFYGGTKLGAGHLLRAYNNAGLLAVK